tara:strand:- start:38 stop:265 length:228 start_codon:yes stop_codon:yes gene_type:complete
MNYIIITEILILLTSLFFVIRWGINLHREQNEEVRLLNEALDLATDLVTAMEKGNDYLASQSNRLERDCKNKGLS